MRKTTKLSKANITHLKNLIRPHFDGLLKHLKKSPYKPNEIISIDVCYERTSGEIIASAFTQSLKRFTFCHKNDNLFEDNSPIDNHFNLFNFMTPNECYNVKMDEVNFDSEKHLKSLYDRWEELLSELECCQMPKIDENSEFIRCYNKNLDKIRIKKINDLLGI